MIATAIVVFREVLEAALIVGIIIAASRGAAGRLSWILGGLLAGLVGSCLVAGFINVITEAASGIGQELLNASILGVAVIMLSWHLLFMKSHGRQMAADAKALGKAASAGEIALFPLATVIAFTVLREGSETVLFLFGLASNPDNTLPTMVLGGLIGAALGIGAGVVIYGGLLRLPISAFFTVTNGLIALLAAGMAAQAAGFLIQADLLPSGSHPVWDTSAFLSEKSLAGKVLHSLLGYQARPMLLQLVAYVGVLFILWIGSQELNIGAHSSRKV